MAIAATATSGVVYIPQVSFGAIPATPTWKALRRTGGDLTTEKVTIVSDEISLDGRVRDVYQVGQDVSGDYAFEFSNGAFDDMIAGVLQSTWTTNVISDGTTQILYAFEERILAGGATMYNRFQDCQVSKLSLDVQARQAVRGSVSIVGTKETTDTVIITGATYPAAGTDIVETAATFASLALTGLGGSTPKVKSLKLNIDRGLRKRELVGSLYSEQHGNSQPHVTGSINAYFEDNVNYAAVLAHTAGALSFQIGTTANKKYTVSIPTIKFTKANRVLGGKNDDAMYDLEWEATGTAAAALLTITRLVA